MRRGDGHGDGHKREKNKKERERGGAKRTRGRHGGDRSHRSPKATQSSGATTTTITTPHTTHGNHPAATVQKLEQIQPLTLRPMGTPPPSRGPTQPGGPGPTKQPPRMSRHTPGQRVFGLSVLVDQKVGSWLWWLGLVCYGMEGCADKSLGGASEFILVYLEVARK
ncbi:hypothetical protein ILYODFUR_006415 [Ilyodon furcidens]|uniref:Uncharacterized protein n=1 Tax=Ilyodon furcidens TaxID=33524 RepID=A0ABV0TV78_9TELE